MQIYSKGLNISLDMRQKILDTHLYKYIIIKTLQRCEILFFGQGYFGIGHKQKSGKNSLIGYERHDKNRPTSAGEALTIFFFNLKRRL